MRNLERSYYQITRQEEISKNDYENFSHIALALIRVGRYQFGLQLLDKCLTICPEEEKARLWFYKGECYKGLWSAKLGVN